MLQGWLDEAGLVSEARYAVLRQELEDAQAAAESSRQSYSTLHAKHVDLLTKQLELLRAVGTIRMIAAGVA
jgi:outer membrane protein TolC